MNIWQTINLRKSLPQLGVLQVDRLGEDDQPVVVFFYLVLMYIKH